jgi:hypothetical protein
MTKRDGHNSGSRQADIREELLRYSAANGYTASHFVDATCACGGRSFRLQLDDEAGAAVRLCVDCSHSHPMGDSADFLEEAELEECACPCGSETCDISVGVSLYKDSDDVRWLYVGCRCRRCGLIAVYGDWKNEFRGHRALLARI